MSFLRRPVLLSGHGFSRAEPSRVLGFSRCDSRVGQARYRHSAENTGLKPRGCAAATARLKAVP